ncbi:MAG: aminotransferase class I/II-fold pyridoxal phosphate-dependent enzyme [bacterium]
MAGNDTKFETRAVHAGIAPESWLGATRPPVFQTAAHSFADAQELHNAFTGAGDQDIYMRLSNPTNTALERRVTELEGGAAAVATASGMAAVADTILAALSGPGHLVAGKSLFMSTYVLLSQVLPRYGIETSFADPARPEEWQEAVRNDTRLFLVETIGNPAMDVPDFEELAKIARRHEVPLAVDNTVATPWLVRPIEHGADIVIHSSTKYLNGHGSALGGLVIDAGSFGFPEEKYPDFKPFKEKAGPKAFLARLWKDIHINFGTTAAPWHSYLTLMGTETLALRMERHSENALELARYLEGYSSVNFVNYLGLESSPFHKRAAELFKGRGFGGLFTFSLQDEDHCFDFIKKLRLARHLANLGDAKTLVIHPWSSQYAGFPEEKRRELGITPEMIRVSTGIEHIDDIREDFKRALSQ